MNMTHNLETIFSLWGGKYKFRNAKPAKGEEVLKNFIEQEYSQALEFVKAFKPYVKGKVRKLYLHNDRGATTLTCSEEKDG